MPKRKLYKTPEEARAAKTQQKRQARALESEEQQQIRRQVDSQRRQTARQNEPEEQQQIRRQVDSQRRQVARQNEPEEQQQIRRNLNNAQMSFARQNETHEQREVRHQVDAAQHRRVYNQERSNLPPSRLLARDASHHPEEFNVGKMDVSCSGCGAMHFRGELNFRRTFSSCCNSGKVAVPPPPAYPEFLRILLESEGDNSKHFRAHIRKYNSAFAFASFGFQSPELPGHGPPVFVVHGQVYHRTPLDINLDTSNPTYAQLYMLDPEFALSNRRNNAYNSDLLPTMLEEIDTYLREKNPFARAFMMMKDVMEQHKHDSNCYVKMWIVTDRQSDLRRYNLPIANEVAAIFVSPEGEPPFNRDIAVHSSTTNQLQHMSITSPNCDPCTYPILFPHGEPGWQINIRNASGSKHKITQQDYYGYLFQERNVQFNPVLHAGKLTEQFVIDAFLKIEASRLHWARIHQKDLRVEQYLGLMDYVNAHAQEENLKPGKIFILPSSFYGSKRAMDQSYQDAMAIVARYGKPDLFITFTCNPNWTEIKEALAPGETAANRPDIVATVFHLKLKQLLHDLLKSQVLGKVIAYQYVIEFQKRGLPHCHMLFILASEDKPRTPEDVDTIVSAEIPDRVSTADLMQIVSKSMIHGPCGTFNPTAPCMDEKDGQRVCTKGFPKPFTPATEMNIDGYPKYKRRDNTVTVNVRGQDLDNRWVVPFNPYLTLKYNAHINVEICTSVKSVKYIFKYIHKGHDAAIVRFSKDLNEDSMDWDEIQHYIDSRYLAAPEAVWRLREYKLYDRSHAIIRLPVHLPNAQAVVFQEGQEQRALEQAQQKGTELTAFFALNRSDPNAAQYFYYEIPLHYVYQKYSSPRVWLPRRRDNKPILPRIYSVSPKDPERFSLKQLLLHVKGPTSFEDLRTVDSFMHNTFKEAAIARNLLEDDLLWSKTMDEAVNYQMPLQLRMLFATILIYCEPTNPKQLYEKYSASLSEDFVERHGADIGEQMALAEIEDTLMQFKKSMLDFALPTPDRSIIPSTAPQLEDLMGAAEALKLMLNQGQLAAYTAVLEALTPPVHTKCFFLSGCAGTGKTFLYAALIKAVQAKGFKVKCVAPTGLAATLLSGGQTVHSGFGLPLQLDGTSVSKIKHGSKEWKELTETKLIIWDEISMCHRHMLEAVDRSLQDLIQNDEIFGGIPIVVGGDFRQQAPVVKRGNRVIITGASVKSSNLWHHFRRLSLTQNMRVDTEELSFQDYLLKIGDLNPEEHWNTDFAKVPTDLITTDIVTSIFGNDINGLTTDELASRAILTPKNDDTLKLNQLILSKLNGTCHSRYSVDSITCREGDNIENYTTEFINSLTPMGMAPHRLNLKAGCCVMLLRNLNPKLGLCNGTRLVVERIGEHNLECKIFSGDKKGSVVLIPKIIMDQTEDSDIPFSLRRKQFPLRLAYSMTITKSQGQTFEHIGVYLPNPVFTHGQLYTAFSRVKRQRGLKIQYNPSSRQGYLKNDEEIHIFNSVYPELL